MAYVIYTDEKGKLRKEASWNSWRDDKIEPKEFDNIPTSGFVLNKKVGDYVSDWNHRQAYVRVYDPRDFEFEITIENLLYILENASSIKGKGLEGEFTYGWDGKDLVLLPVDSPDYKEIIEFNEIVHENKTIKAKDLIIGATYKTKQDIDYVYMGRFDAWDYKYGKGISDRININKGKHHYFARKSKGWRNEDYLDLITTKSISGRFISVVSTECVENYAELFDMLEANTSYSPLDKSKDEYIPYTLEEVIGKINNNKWKEFECYGVGRSEYKISTYGNEIGVYSYSIREHGSYRWGYKKKDTNSLEEIYNIVKPAYKNEYLQNGKLYKEGK